MLSFKSLYTRTTDQDMDLSQLKSMDVEEANELYEHRANNLIAGMQKEHIDKLTESVARIEKEVLNSARELPLYARLCTFSGIGRILGMTITMEVGDIHHWHQTSSFWFFTHSIKG